MAVSARHGTPSSRRAVFQRPQPFPLPVFPRGIPEKTQGRPIVTAEPQNDTLRTTIASVFKGQFHSTIGAVALMAVKFVSLIVLARLVPPTEYGLFYAAYAVVSV